MSDNYGERCPCCRTKWKVTHFGKNTWKDCLVCEDTAENLTKKAIAETPTKKYQGADWLKDWEEEYTYSNYSGTKYTGVDSGGISLDDDDDWGDIPFLQEKINKLYQEVAAFGKSELKLQPCRYCDPDKIYITNQDGIQTIIYYGPTPKIKGV